MKCFNIQFGSGNIRQIFAESSYQASDIARGMANATRDSVRSVREVVDQNGQELRDNVDELKETSTDIKYLIQENSSDIKGQIEDLKALLESHFTKKNTESTETVKLKNLSKDLSDQKKLLAEVHEKNLNSINLLKQKEGELNKEIEDLKKLITQQKEQIQFQQKETIRFKEQSDKLLKLFVPKIDFKIKEWDQYCEPLKGTDALKITNEQMFNIIKKHLLEYNKDSEELINNLIKIALTHLEPSAYTVADVRDLMMIYKLQIDAGDYEFTTRAIRNHLKRISEWPPLYQEKY
jgi:chromosome segregation ATPase